MENGKNDEKGRDDKDKFSEYAFFNVDEKHISKKRIFDQGEGAEQNKNGLMLLIIIKLSDYDVIKKGVKAIKQNYPYVFFIISTKK